MRLTASPGILAASLALLGLAAAACGSNNNAKTASAVPTTQKVAPSGTTGSAALAVDIKGTAFPATINVAPGTRVTWTNRDGFPHTVTADSGQTETFDSKPIDGQAAFSTTFTKTGTFAYDCNIHSSMHGTVVVGTGPAGVSTPVKGQGVPDYGY